MKSLVFLVVLLFLFEKSAQEADQKPQRQDDVQETQNEKRLAKLDRQTENTLCNAKLEELRDMVTDGMQILKDKLSEQAAALKATQDELSAIKKELQQQKSDQQTNLQRDTSELETVRRENSALRSQLTAFESRMVWFEKTLGDAKQSQVAFSVGLTDSGKVGPYTGVTTLVYNKIFSNVGRAYNPASGIFTAPTKGVYYFTFTGYNNQPHPGALVLYRNWSILRHPQTASSQPTYFSNAVTIQLQAGDNVYVQLPAYHSLYDNNHHYCTLTGFLLFPL